MNNSNTKDSQPVFFRTQRVIAANPHAIYKAIDTIEGIQGWWSPDVRGGTEIGNAIQITFPSVDEFIVMKIKDKREDSYIIWECTERRGPSKITPDEWTGTTVTFRIEQQKEQLSLLSIVHEGVEALGWSYFLDSIADYIETGVGTPFISN